MLPGFSSCRWTLDRHFCPIHTECLQRCSSCCSAAALTGQGVKQPLLKTHSENTGTCASHFPVKPLLAGETYQQERLPKFDSPLTGIMRILDISFQYSPICKYLPGSRFQALNVFAKQEPSTNKDQPPSLQLAWLNLLEPLPSPPASVRAAWALPGTWIRCRGSCKTQNPRIC